MHLRLLCLCSRNSQFGTTTTSRPSSAHAPSSSSRPSSANLVRGADAAAHATVGKGYSKNSTKDGPCSQEHGPCSQAHASDHHGSRKNTGTNRHGDRQHKHRDSHKHHREHNNDEEGSTAPPPPLTEAEQFKADQDAGAEEVEANRHRLLLWYGDVYSLKTKSGRIQQRMPK